MNAKMTGNETCLIWVREKIIYVCNSLWVSPCNHCNNLNRSICRVHKIMHLLKKTQLDQTSISMSKVKIMVQKMDGHWRFNFKNYWQNPNRPLFKSKFNFWHTTYRRLIKLIFYADTIFYRPYKMNGSNYCNVRSVGPTKVSGTNTTTVNKFISVR